MSIPPNPTPGLKPSNGSVMGTRVLRREDQVLLTGHARFVDDLDVDGALVACFVRSTQAHARILSIDAADASAVPGVVGVLTSADLDGLMAGSRFPMGPHLARSALAHDVVRFQGEPVAVVLAETLHAASDALEAVIVEFDPLPVVLDPEASLAAGAAELFPEAGSDSLIMKFPAVDDLHEDADQILTARFVNTRMSAVPLECHGIVAEPRGDGGVTMHVSTQGVHTTRGGLAEALGLDESLVDVVAPWVGGGFGAKGGWQPEHVVVAHLARTYGKPVSWKETRSENLVSMQARDQIQHARLGLRSDGTITSLEVIAISDAGAYPGMGAMLPMATRLMAQGNYRIPKIQFDCAAVATNKGPLGAFRGAGRPQATYFVERLIDMAARELALDPVDMRRRNLLQQHELPVTTATGAEYDSGDYPLALETAVERVDYARVRQEQAERRAAGDHKQLGIGVACYVEVTAPFGTSEFAGIEILPTGRVQLRVGTGAHGQGHETTFAMIVADQLRIPVDAVDLIQSDTRLVERGMGTNGSRSVQLAGSATLAACEQVIDHARELAASLLEANVEDIEVSEGGLQVAGVPTSRLSWAALVSASLDDDRRPSHLRPGLGADTDFEQGCSTFPYGAHAAVVEVDTDTGAVELVHMVSVDDCGTIINPTLVEGQQHGGLATGISQALYEHIAYDEHGNLLTGNLASYAMPSAAEFPFFDTASLQTPTPHNALGAKGIGEAATIGSTPAVANAVIDALAPMGITHIDLPLTPERVWRAMSDAREGNISAPGHPWPIVTTGDPS